MYSVHKEQLKILVIFEMFVSLIVYSNKWLQPLSMIYQRISN
jgi:hypothetical protein